MMALDDRFPSRVDRMQPADDLFLAGFAPPREQGFERPIANRLVALSNAGMSRPTAASFFVLFSSSSVVASPWLNWHHSA